jgi:hypothetical protein
LANDKEQQDEDFISGFHIIALSTISPAMEDGKQCSFPAGLRNKSVVCAQPAVGRLSFAVSIHALEMNLRGGEVDLR